MKLLVFNNLVTAQHRTLVRLLCLVLVLLSFPAPAQAEGTWYLVGLAPGTNPEVLQTVVNQTELVFHKDNLAPVYRVQSNQDSFTLKEKLGHTLTFIEPEQQYKAIAIETNDPGFSNIATNIDRQWGLLKAKYPDAWSTTKGSTDVVVAVLDTGIDETHEDLAGAGFVGGYDFVNNKDILLNTNSDDNGHGTLVAGVIGAVPNNGIGIAGTNWNISLMPMKALDSSGSGSSSNVSKAIVWAVDHGANVINFSIGGYGFKHDTTFSEAISYAYDKNVVLVAAAGNDVAITGGNLDIEPAFPVCMDNGANMMIGVTATDVNDLKPDFANFGKNCIDVTAPGRRILSTINHDPVTGGKTSNSYAYASGTSLAVPFVSGLAGLLKALYPVATNQQIRDQIIKTADQIDNLNFSQCARQNCSGLLGAGRINAYRAVTETLVEPRIKNGDLVQTETGQLYYINGGKRQPVGSFVRTQRFTNTQPKTVTSSELRSFPEGSFAEALEGTLLKTQNDPTVFYMSKGVRQPVLASVFSSRGYLPIHVQIPSDVEMASWTIGSLLAPPEGTLVRSTTNPTVYWVISGVLHPVNNVFYTTRGLNIFPIIFMPERDVNGLSKGEAYIL